MRFWSLHVPRPIIGALEAAHAVAAVARGSDKPVLGAWLGAVNRPDVQDALEAGGIANFFTPENAVDAFSFLAAYRRNQEWLLEVPPSQPDPEPPDLAAAERIREHALAQGRGMLACPDAQELLAAFGIVTAPFAIVTTLAEAQAAARRLRYPITLMHDDAVSPISAASIVNGRALARAWRELQEAATQQKRTAGSRVIVQRATPPGVIGAYAIALATDPVFGPVIAAGPSAYGTTCDARACGDAASAQPSPRVAIC